jgi:hypothetical protein
VPTITYLYIRYYHFHFTGKLEILFQADNQSELPHTHTIRLPRTTFSSYQEIYVRSTKLRVLSRSICRSQRQGSQRHNMTESKTIDYQIDYRAVIFPPTLYHFHIYYPIFQPAREVLVTQMRSTHLSGRVSIYVRAGTTSLIFKIFCEDVMPFKGCIMPSIITFCSQLYPRERCVNS